jgi:5'-methylthioadenosine phosphorylase
VINYAAGLAPAVIHAGPGSMVDFYYGSGFHAQIEDVIRAALKGMPEERACGCGRALQGAFHGTPPAWLRARY